MVVYAVSHLVFNKYKELVKNFVDKSFNAYKPTNAYQELSNVVRIQKHKAKNVAIQPDQNPYEDILAI
jgi:hypothetical protein